MAPSFQQPTKTLLDAVEQRLDGRLNDLEKLLNQSIASIKEIYENKIDSLEEKIDRLQDSFCSKLQNESALSKERRSNKFTLTLTIIGWLLTFGLAVYNADLSDHSNQPPPPSISSLGPHR